MAAEIKSAAPADKRTADKWCRRWQMLLARKATFDKATAAVRALPYRMGTRRLLGRIQGGVEAMGFGKFGLRCGGVLEAKKRLGEVVVGVGEGGIEADGFAVTDRGVLKFSGVEESGAQVEAEIGIIGLEGNEFLERSDGVAEFVGSQLAVGETDEGVSVVGFLGVGLLVVVGGLGVILFPVVSVGEIVKRVEVSGIERASAFEGLIGVGDFALIELGLTECEEDIGLVRLEDETLIEGGDGLIVAFGLGVEIAEMRPSCRLLGMAGGEFVVSGDGFMGLARLIESTGIVLEYVGLVGLEVVGVPEVGDGFGRFVLGEKPGTEIVEGVDIFWAKSDGGSEG